MSTNLKVHAKIPFISIVCWNHNMYKDAPTKPIKVCVFYNGKRRYYPILDGNQKLLLSVADWQTISSGKTIRDRARVQARVLVESYKSRASEAASRAMKNNRPFTWEKFEDEFLHRDSEKGFLAIFKQHLDAILSEKRIGTYNSYKNAYSAFHKFRKERELSPFDVTPSLLKDFEKFLLDQPKPCNKTTIGIYLRTIRLIFNLAADENPALLEVYPFARKRRDRSRYRIKSGSGHKGKALSIEQFKALRDAPTEVGSLEHEAKSLWLFSFYCWGMNIKDICLLKYSDIQDGILTYTRAKTKDTGDREDRLEIPLCDQVIQILNEIGNADRRQSSYLFPIIPLGLGSQVKRRDTRTKSIEERITEIVKQKTKMINKRVKIICQRNKLPMVTTYWARHTWATFLKQIGARPEIIQEILGHETLKTTLVYLAKNDASEKRDVVNKLLIKLNGKD
jgi:integrase/recombinase XerD